MSNLPYFFRPNQNWENILPALLLIGIGLILVFCLWLTVHFVRLNRARTMTWKRFHIMAKRYLLTRFEESLLKRIATQAKISTPTRLLTQADLFERQVRPIEEGGRRYEKRLVSSIRQKLFERTLQPYEVVRSTHSLVPGTRLFIQYADGPDNVCWGHLVDVDRNGLIVIIPSNREMRAPLPLNAQLQVTAYIPNHEPVFFSTWVQSVIPGPRKMVVLGHSNFVISKSELQENIRLIGPQFNPHTKLATSQHRKSQSTVRPIRKLSV